MNESDRQFERKLAALSPRPISVGLRSRLSAALERRRLWRIAAAGALAAAALVAIATLLPWWWGRKPMTPTERKSAPTVLAKREPLRWNLPKTIRLSDLKPPSHRLPPIRFRPGGRRSLKISLNVRRISLLPRKKQEESSWSERIEVPASQVQLPSP